MIVYELACCGGRIPEDDAVHAQAAEKKSRMINVQACFPGCLFEAFLMPLKLDLTNFLTKC